MKTKLFTFALMALFTMPCALCAEEVVIQLMEVITMSPLPGDGPLDDSNQTPPEPPRPNDFRATITGQFLRVTKQNANIPSAQVSVVNASNGSLVLNQLITNSLEETISNNAVYILHIETDGGALVGQFIVQ